MADWKALFTSSDFEAYQDRVVDESASWLHEVLFSGTVLDPRSIKQHCDTIRMVLELPGNLVKDPAISNRLAARARARLMEIPAALLRRELSQE